MVCFTYISIYFNRFHRLFSAAILLLFTYGNSIAQPTTVREHINHGPADPSMTISQVGPEARGSAVLRNTAPDTTSATPNIVSAQAFLQSAKLYIKQKKYALALKMYYRAYMARHKAGTFMQILQPADTLESKNPDKKTTLQPRAIATAARIEDQGNNWLSLGPPLPFDSSTRENLQKRPAKSSPVTARAILETFKDHKTAEAYGLFIHVQQPVAGKRRQFKWFDGVGHSFITLIKYNEDGSCACMTYGFYPKKYFIFQATPIFPLAPSDYKDDAWHPWDESIGKFISVREFRQILRLTKRYAKHRYHLSRNNCTDFVLKIASIAGVYIEQTKGHWPLGEGNDPGDTGQSILENKYRAEPNSVLFVNTPNVRDTSITITSTPILGRSSN